MRMRLELGILLLLLAATASVVSPLEAQQNTYVLVGRARDESGAPLGNVQITVRGTRFGTVTDTRGSFGISAQLQPGTYVVEAQLIGRETATQEVALGAPGSVTVPDFVLRQQALQLDEIVVTGTAAPTTRRALGNAVSTVSGRQLAETPATTIDQALQGKVAGAVITSNTGTPGGGVSIRLRGTSSIVGGAEPLYIVDGVIIDNNGDQQVNFGYRSNPSNRLADLDPNDIERVEILKGAAAAALYGSRANNGVVQIFTKRGRAGAPVIMAGYRTSRSDLPRDIDFALTPKDLTGNTVQRFDHQDLIFREPWSYDTYLSISGGTDETKYYLSGNWVTQNGIMRGSDHEKLNVRMNLDQSIGTRFGISAGANFVRNHTDLVINGEQGFGGLLTAIVFTPTDVDLAKRDPQTRELVNKQAGPFPNPLIVLENWETPQDVNRFIGSFQARANPVSTLRMEYRLGFDRYEMETGLAIPRGDPNAATGSSSSYNRRNMLINNDVVVNYDYGPGDDLRFNSSVGMNHTYQRVDQFNLGASDLTPFTMLVRGAVQTASEGQVEAVTLGYFGQQQMQWKNRLFLTGAIRFDASSTFGADERWQMYPKVSGSWVVSEEPFWGIEWWPELRLRAALGYAGNQPPLGEAYTRRARYSSTTNINRLGLVPMATPGNPDLKPERQREWELGFESSFLKERLGARFTYYDQYTKDLLLVRPFVPSAGYASLLDNVGEMSNKGVELELSTININRPSFGWNSRFIYSANRNQVEKLNVAPFTAGYTNRVIEGQPLGVHYMLAYERDASGNIVLDSIGPVRTAAAQIVGDPWPDFTASLVNEFRFGENFSASVLLDGSFGAEVWNQTQRIMDIFGAGPLYDRLLRGEITSAYRSRVQGIWEAYLEDATYVKLRDLTLRYSTNADWLRAIGASGMQLEVTGRNLYTWTDYTGYDPEVNMFGLSTVERGTDFAVYPNPRTIGFGVRLTY